MKVETFMDYENFANKYRNEPDAENTDAGSGTSDDYGDFQFTPDSSLGPESILSETEKEIIQEAKKQPATPPAKKEDTKNPANVSDKDKKQLPDKKKPVVKPKPDNGR
jgi:Asp-tRNA(Asn)/Glu-tRNA(Gln) amidotransferase B subunit